MEAVVVVEAQETRLRSHFIMEDEQRLQTAGASCKQLAAQSARRDATTRMVRPSLGDAAVVSSVRDSRSKVVRFCDDDGGTADVRNEASNESADDGRGRPVSPSRCLPLDRGESNHDRPVRGRASRMSMIATEIDDRSHDRPVAAVRGRASRMSMIATDIDDRSRRISPSRRRSLDEGEKSKDEDDISESSPKAEQLEWLLDWLNGPGTSKVRKNRRCSVEDASSDSEDIDEIYIDEGGQSEDANAAAPTRKSAPTEDATCNHVQESADASIPSPSNVPLHIEAGCGDEFNTPTATISELRRVVSELEGTAKDKDEKIARLEEELTNVAGEHARRENELNESISKLERRLKRSTGKEKKQRKEIGSLTRELTKIESELEEADEICDLSNLQMEKMQAAFDVERMALKEEAARKALDYESVIAKLEARISERHVVVEEHHVAERYVAVEFESESDKERDMVMSRYPKLVLSPSQRCLLYFCVLLFVLSGFARLNPKANVMPKWMKAQTPSASQDAELMKERANRTERQSAALSKPQRRRLDVDVNLIQEFYLF